MKLSIIKKLNVFILLISLLLCGCSHKNELKNDDYSFKVTKAIDGNAEVFLSNQSGKRQENVRVLIYIQMLDINKEYVFYEKIYDVLEKDQIVWDVVDYSNKEYVDKMVIADKENDELKSNFVFVYEIYDNR